MDSKPLCPTGAAIIIQRYLRSNHQPPRTHYSSLPRRSGLRQYCTSLGPRSSLLTGQLEHPRASCVRRSAKGPSFIFGCTYVPPWAIIVTPVLPQRERDLLICETDPSTRTLLLRSEPDHQLGAFDSDFHSCSCGSSASDLACCHAFLLTDPKVRDTAAKLKRCV